MMESWTRSAESTIWSLWLKVCRVLQRPYYARIVREKATLRGMIEASGTTLMEAHTSTEDAQIVLEQAEQRIFKIAQKREHASSQDLGSLLDEAIKAIEANDGQTMGGLPSGFKGLDELTNGLQSGEMLILAARPSMGKTAVALNIIEHASMAGHPCAFFSLEMGRHQLVQRLICARGSIDSQRLRRNMLRARISPGSSPRARSSRRLRFTSMTLPDFPCFSFVRRPEG